MKRILTLVTLITLLAACEKNDGKGGNGVDRQLKAILDTSWAITQEAYLWYDQLPDSYTEGVYKDPNALMESIRPYSREAGFTQPVDRWSFAMKQAEWNNVSSGISGDFGLGIFFLDQFDLRVSYVEPASPAGRAEIERGWQIVSINGDRNIDARNQNSINKIIAAVFNGTSTTFIFKKANGQEQTISLNAATYVNEPFLFADIITSNDNVHKIGYVVFNSFLGDTTKVKNQISNVFNGMAGEGITDLVIDLRYNGGGYVLLQNELANHLAPHSANGKLMVKQQFNTNLSRFNSSVPFTKKGNLDMQRIFFIIGSGTASASELLINSLKPHMDVKLVGRPSNGKPVGYAALPVGDWYIFPVSSKTVNSAGVGDYYDGFQPDAIAADGLNENWGIDENCLSYALYYILRGSFPANDNAQSRIKQMDNSGNKQLDERKFSGAVHTLDFK